MIFENYIDIAQSLMRENTERQRHYSFIIRKNRILSIGLNYNKTHPMSFKFNYSYPTIHSEISAIVRFNDRINELNKCILVNVRLDKKGKVLLSKPCNNCMRLIVAYDFKKVFYTNNNGTFEEL